MSRCARLLALVLLSVCCAACGGGGGGSDSSGDPPDSGGPGDPGGDPSDPANVTYLPHFQADQDFTIPYPDGWNRTFGGGVGEPDVVVTFEAQSFAGSSFRYNIKISVVPVGSPTLSTRISNIDELERRQISIGDISAQEIIFDAVYEGVALDLRFMETVIEVGQKTYSILFAAERESLFDILLPVVRDIVQRFDVGSTLIEVERLLDPGRSAVGSNGDRFLAVVCRDEDRQSFFSGSIVAVLVEAGNRRVIAETQIDDQFIACAGLSPSVTWDGSNFLVTYIRQMALPISVNGQSVMNDQLSVVGKRVSQTGQLLDADPILISTEGTTQETNVFVAKPAADSVAAFDGSRHVVVWDQQMNSNELERDFWRQIHGAFVSPDGTVSENFVVFDRILGLYGQANYFRWRPDVAVGAGQMMVVLGPRAEPSVAGDPRPVYAQMVDLNGVNLLADPLLIRADAGERPRYPQVASDGTNFVVAWIQGEQSPSDVNGGFYGINARRVSPAGQLLNGSADSDGFEVLAEIEEPREYLELYYSGSDFLAFWSVIAYRNNSGVWGTKFAADLSSVDPASPVGGIRQDAGGRALDNPETISFAQGNSTGLVAWTVSHFVKGWFLDAGFPD